MYGHVQGIQIDKHFLQGVVKQESILNSLLSLVMETAHTNKTTRENSKEEMS